MNPFSSPDQAMRLWMQTALMLTEAQTVITLRLMGMAGLLVAAPGENARMLREKSDAMLESGLGMARAAARGGTATGIALAGLKPVRQRTRNNVARLTRKD